MSLTNLLKIKKLFKKKKQKLLQKIKKNIFNKINFLEQKD